MNIHDYSFLNYNYTVLFETGVAYKYGPDPLPVFPNYRKKKYIQFSTFNPQSTNLIK